MMTRLLDDAAPYAPRDDAEFLEAMNELTRFHRGGCAPYRKILGDRPDAASIDALPFLHVGLFKRLELVTAAPELRHGRMLHSSATSSNQPSRIALDDESSALQARSTQLVLEDFLGVDRKPLLILDSARSLLARGQVSARLAAALSLKPLSTGLHFLLSDPMDPASLKLDVLDRALEHTDGSGVMLYGFTWLLWLAFTEGEGADLLAERLGGQRVQFVHSGGWKKLESLKIAPETFDERLLASVGPESSVLDFYGLAEQVGIIYPRCSEGFRHAPRWADVRVRDPHSLEALTDRPGLLQLMNVLPRGAPYHNVLTEDLAELKPGPCACGRAGTRFRLLGRVPKAELRGCANV